MQTLDSSKSSAKKKVKYSMARNCQRWIYCHIMWCQLSTSFRNLLKCSNWELIVAVDHKQLRTMASETVDPIDWSPPLPYRGQYPLISMYSTVQCGLEITRLASTSEDRTIGLLNASPTHCPIECYSSVSGGLRETKSSIWVQGSICYRGYGSVKSTVLFLNFSRIMQFDICVRALERNHQ